MRFCSKCGAQNNDADSFCNQCGTPLAIPVVVVGNDVKKKPALSGPAKTVHTITKICLVVILFFKVLSGILDLTAGSQGKDMILFLVGFAADIVLFIGLKKLNNNILPGVAFMMSAGLSLFNFTDKLFEYEVFDLFIVLVFVTVNILLGMLFINKKPNGRELWYLPVILAGLLLVMRAISLFELYSGYSFNWQGYLAALLGYAINPILLIVFSALVAKLCWFVNPAPEQKN